MSEYPKLLFDRYVMMSNDGTRTESFHIRNILSSNSFRTAYYDIILVKNKLKIIKDDAKATLLSGYNFHKNAEIRFPVFSNEVNMTHQKFSNSITHKSYVWAEFLMNLGNVRDKEKKICDFVEEISLC